MDTFDRKMIKRIYGLGKEDAFDVEKLSSRAQISLGAAAKIIANRKKDSNETNHKE